MALETILNRNSLDVKKTQLHTTIKKLQGAAVCHLCPIMTASVFISISCGDLKPSLKLTKEPYETL